MIGANLERQEPVRCQVSGGLRGDFAHQIQAVGAAVEREARLEVAHVDWQRRDLVGGNVRRIASHEIEASRADGLEQRAVDEPHVTNRSGAVQVVGRHGQRIGRNVGRGHAPCRPLSCKRDRDTARAGAKIQGLPEHAFRAGALERYLDQPFAVGAGDEHAPVDAQVDAEKLALAQQIRDRFAGASVA